MTPANAHHEALERERFIAAAAQRIFAGYAARQLETGESNGILTPADEFAASKAWRLAEGLWAARPDRGQPETDPKPAGKLPSERITEIAMEHSFPVGTDGRRACDVRAADVIRYLDERLGRGSP